MPSTHISRNFEYPKDLEDEFGKARRIVWITVIYLLTAIMMMAAVMSNSQQEGHVYISVKYLLFPQMRKT